MDPTPWNAPPDALPTDREYGYTPKTRRDGRTLADLMAELDVALSRLADERASGSLEDDHA